MTSEKIRFVSKYPVKRYRCGLRAGDSVKLRKNIEVTDQSGQPTGIICRKGETWAVLQGTKGIVWLRQQDGQMHTWDDDQSIYETFEKVERTTARAIRGKSNESIASRKEKRHGKKDGR
ncbi:hypothetical protein DNFV4_03575 [Nitrospira tepida]|uniref:Uncharacterized protein n=1 Tax=Nitrospira tepida TaxID=2973512 RepID=A0AA86N1S6_9BACT|nr:hypothetical protein [Nitrospira tepida]CAI4033142.1 hypothetical protein DNFV4_03575 [Nitrospira tepida]